MSNVTDPRPFYAESFTATSDAVVGTAATPLSIPSNTESLIIYNLEAVGGTVLQYAIFDTYGGTELFGGALPAFVSIPAATLPEISAAPLTYLQQIGIGYVAAGASLPLLIGPEGNRASLAYVDYIASGYIDINEPVTIIAGDTFTSDSNPPTGPFSLTAAIPVNATGTVTAVGVLVGDTVTVGGVVFTAVAATATPTAIQFRVGSTNTITATNIATVIGAHPSLASVSPWLVATSALNVVTFTAPGLLGNVALASSNGLRLPVSAATLLGGVGPGVDVFNIGAATATTTAAGITASNIAVAINDIANSFDTFLDALAFRLHPPSTVPTVAPPAGVSSTVGGRADLAAAGVFQPGVVGNGIPLAVTGTGMVISGAFLTGGAPDRYILLFQGVGGTVSTSVVLTQGRGYTGPP